MNIRKIQNKLINIIQIRDWKIIIRLVIVYTFPS